MRALASACLLERRELGRALQDATWAWCAKALSYLECAEGHRAPLQIRRLYVQAMWRVCVEALVSVCTQLGVPLKIDYVGGRESNEMRRHHEITAVMLAFERAVLDI